MSRAKWVTAAAAAESEYHPDVPPKLNSKLVYLHTTTICCDDAGGDADDNRGDDDG